MQVDKNPLYSSFFVIILSAFMAVSCGDVNFDDEEDEEAAETGTTDTGSGTDTDISSVDTDGDNEISHEEVISSNTLALAYPSGLSLSVFPQASSSTSLRLADDETDPTKETIAEKIEEENEILSGTGDDCLGDIFGHDAKEPEITCYEFDQEMIFGAMHGPLGTRHGIVSATDNEACLVAFARSKVAGVQTMVERGLGLVQGMMCQAKKSGLAENLPAVGEVIDLKTQITEAMGTRAQSVSSASIRRIADEGGHPVYRTDIVLVLNVTENGQSSSMTQEMHLVHSPQDETNTDYLGTLWTKVARSSATATQAPGMPSDNYLSIRYARLTDAAGVPSMQAELVRAQLNSALSEKAFVSGVLDLNVGASFADAAGTPNYGSYHNPQTSQPFQNSNEAISGMMYVAFSLNPDDNTGVTSYWQNPGGNYSENARGMIFSLGKNPTTGVLEGCGTSGATGSSQNNATSIRMALKENQPGKLIANGFYHPFFSTVSNDFSASCTFGSGEDAEGKYHTKICDPNASPLFNTETKATNPGVAMNAKWWKPKIADAAMSALADTWVTAQTGSIITKQCVKQDAATGKYVIDTVKTPEVAGFSLIDTAITSDASVKGPVLTGLKTLKVE